MEINVLDSLNSLYLQLHLYTTKLLYSFALPGPTPTYKPDLKFPYNFIY